MSFLQGLLEKAFSGHGSLVLVAGEAGIGKSRLTEEFCKHAQSKGARIMLGRCIPGVPTPYLPFQDALQHAFTPRPHERRNRYRRLLGSLKRSTPELIGLAPIIGNILQVSAALYREYREYDLEPESGRERTLHATREFLQSISSKEPALMVIDDLQWADSASVHLLHFLARNSEGLRMLIIGTYRPEDLQVDGGEKLHLLRESLTIMRREGICHEILLHRLTADELEVAVEGMLEGQVEERLLQRIAWESGGNPLFMVEVVRLLLETKSIARYDDAWKAASEIQLDIPATVRDVITRRIDLLSAEERRLLECASVVGESFDPVLLQEAFGISTIALLETLDSIGRRFQLIASTEEGYRFSHQKVQQVLYDGLSPLRRRELHRIIARKLVSRLPNESLYGELSTHYCKAGERDECVKYSLLAGQSSLRRFAVREAITYLQRVVVEVEREPTMHSEWLQALEGLGDAYLAEGLYERARASYENSLRICDGEKTSEKIRILRKTAEVFLWTFEGGTMGAEELLNEAETSRDVEPSEVGQINSIRGYIASLTGGFSRAEDCYSIAEKAFEETGETENLAHTLLDHCVLDLSRGYVKLAMEKATRASRLFSGLQSPIGELDASIRLGHIYQNLGITEKALASYENAHKIAARFGRQASLAWAHAYKSLVHYNADDFESAEIEANKSLEYASKTEGKFIRAIAIVVRVLCGIEQQRIVEAERLYREASSILESAIATDIRTPTHSYALLAKAELLTAQGNWTEARMVFLQSIERAQTALLGPLFEAVMRTRFAEALLRHGEPLSATKQFEEALNIFDRLGNIYQGERLKGLMTPLLKPEGH